MSEFTEDEVKALGEVGNVEFNAKYMAHFGKHELPPNGSDAAKMKEFIRQKYVEKKWYQGDHGANSAPSNSGFGAFGSGEKAQASRSVSSKQCPCSGFVLCND